MIDKKDVEYLANLSRLELLAGEADSLTKEIDSILDYVGQIQKVSGDLKKGKPKLRNVMRDDVVSHKSGEFSEKLLKNVPNKEGDYVKVKKIL